MRRRQNKGTSAPAAITLLVVCGGIALFSLRSQFGDIGRVVDGDATGAIVDDGEQAADDEQVPPPGVDLLLQHGSWQSTTPVRMAFASLTTAAAAAAVPAGETAPVSNRQWIGADPPTMHVGVVMVGDSVRRAVIDGRVVGLGDTVGRALIVAIDRDIVVATWGGKRLSYDLENDYPREFRAELKRRGNDPGATAKTAAADKLQEEPQ